MPMREGRRTIAFRVVLFGQMTQALGELLERIVELTRQRRIEMPVFGGQSRDFIDPAQQGLPAIV